MNAQDVENQLKNVRNNEERKTSIHMLQPGNENVMSFVECTAQGSPLLYVIYKIKFCLLIPASTCVQEVVFR